MLSSLRELKSETSEALVGGDEYRLLGLQLGASVSFFGLEGNIVVYYYEKARTRHTSYPDGLEVYEFPNEQVCVSLMYGRRICNSTNDYMNISNKTEHHFPNGEKLITFTDGTTKAMFKNGMQVNRVAGIHIHLKPCNIKRCVRRACFRMVSLSENTPTGHER